MTMKRLNRRTLIFASVTLLVLVVMIISFREPPVPVDSAPVTRGQLGEDEQVVQVPASALFRDDDTWVVYVIEDNEAVRRTVIPGRRSGSLTEVQDGLEPGEEVILKPSQEIEPGRRLEVR